MQLINTGLAWKVPSREFEVQCHVHMNGGHEGLSLKEHPLSIADTTLLAPTLLSTLPLMAFFWKGRRGTS